MPRNCVKVYFPLSEPVTGLTQRSTTLHKENAVMYNVVFLNRAVAIFFVISFSCCCSMSFCKVRNNP